MAASRFLSGNGEAARAEGDQARKRNAAAASAAGGAGLSNRGMEQFSGRSFGGESRPCGSEPATQSEPSGGDGSSIRRRRAVEKGHRRPGGFATVTRLA